MNQYSTAHTGEPQQRRMLRAIAYYRQSGRIGQSGSIEVQQDIVRSFAEKEDIEVIHEFEDQCKSRPGASGRPALNEMSAAPGESAGAEQ